MTKTRSGSSVKSHQHLATLIVLSGFALLASASATAGGYAQVGTKLVSPVPGPVLFGGGVGTSGNGQVVVIGAVFVDGERGAAWVYERSGQSWRERERLVPTGPALTRGGAFGEWIAVSQNGGVIAIGAPDENKYRGAVWVFVRRGARWVEQAVLTGGTQEIGDGGFGGAVAMSGDGGTIAVGAPGDRPASTQPESGGYGAVWIFTRNGTNWQQDGPKLVAKGDTSEGDFGDRLALSGSGSTLLVGAYGVNVGRQIGRGSAWVFTRGAHGWQQQAQLPSRGGISYPTDGVRYQLEFGGSVALSSDGQTALVSGDDQDNNHGAVWRFKHTADGWRQQGGLITTPAHRPGDTQGGFGFTVGVTAHGHTELIGETAYNDSIGTAWVFTHAPAAPAAQELTGTQEVGHARFTLFEAISANGATIVIGGPYDNHQQGAAWIYQTTTPNP